MYKNRIETLFFVNQALYVVRSSKGFLEHVLQLICQNKTRDLSKNRALFTALLKIPNFKCNPS